MTLLCKIRDVNMAISAYEKDLISKTGLSLNEGMLLCCIEMHGKITSTNIAESLDLTCSNTSKIIKSVESKGLIERSFGCKDKRVMEFKLTAKGIKVLDRINDGGVVDDDIIETLSSLIVL